MSKNTSPTVETSATVVEKVPTNAFAGMTGPTLADSAKCDIAKMNEADLRNYALAAQERLGIIGRAAYADKGGHVVVNNKLIGKAIHVNPDKRVATKMNPFTGKAQLVNNKPVFENKAVAATIDTTYGYIHAGLRLAMARAENGSVSLIGQGERTDESFVSALAVAKERTW